MAYRRVRNYGNTMGPTRGTETHNSSRAPEYTPPPPPRFYLDSCYSIFSFLFILLSIAVCPFFFAHCVVCPSILIGETWFQLGFFLFYLIYSCIGI